MLIAEDGAADVIQVHANLVGSTGLRHHAEGSKAVESLQYFVKSFRRPPGGGDRPNGHLFPVMGMDTNRKRNDISVPVGRADNEGKILFFHNAVVKLAG